MPNGYGTYLFYILLVIIVFLILLLTILNRMKKRKKGNIKPPCIEAGNIGAFFDKEKNVSIIPYVMDKYGMGRATGDIVLLSYPFQAERLGNAMRKAMSMCNNGVACKDEELMSKLGFRGWKEFSEGKRNISVHYQKGHGIVFNTTRRKVDGSYQFNHFGFEKTVNNDATDKELGNLLMVLLQRCK